MRIPKNKIIKVYWLDHASNSEWNTITELKKWAKERYNFACSTIGTCIIDEKNYIVVSSENDGDESLGNSTLIMKSCIKKIEVIK